MQILVQVVVDILYEIQDMSNGQKNMCIEHKLYVQAIISDC
jgi:hypothetical protein